VYEKERKQNTIKVIIILHDFDTLVIIVHLVIINYSMDYDLSPITTKIIFDVDKILKKRGWLKLFTQNKK